MPTIYVIENKNHEYYAGGIGNFGKLQNAKIYSEKRFARIVLTGIEQDAEIFQSGVFPKLKGPFSVIKAEINIVPGETKGERGQGFCKQKAGKPAKNVACTERRK